MGQHAAVFYLVRHAHADWTPDEIRPLSPEGAKAAQELADHLAAYPVARIVSSDSLRAQQTVAPLARLLALPVVLEPDLRERRLTASALPAEAFRGEEAHRDAVRATWEAPHFAHPGGESNAAAQARGVAVLQRLRRAHSSRHTVLSTHGNLLSLILQHFDPSISFDFWASLRMPDVVVLTIDDQNQAKVCRPEWRDRSQGETTLCPSIGGLTSETTPSH